MLEQLNALKHPAKLVLFPLNKDIFKSRTSIVEDNLIDKPSSRMLILHFFLPILDFFGFSKAIKVFLQIYMNDQVLIKCNTRLI